MTDVNWWMRGHYYEARPPRDWGMPADLDFLSGVTVNGHDATAAHRATVRAANQRRQERERRQRAVVAALLGADVVVGDVGDVEMDAGL